MQSWIRLIGVMAFGVCVCACSSRGGDPRGSLGKSCMGSSSDCGELSCDTSEPIFGLCTARCTSSDECKIRFGLGSFCIGAGRCVRECVTDADCLPSTNCDDDLDWCR